MFSRAVGREEHCKQTSLVCVGSARGVWATPGLLPLTACVLSQSISLRLQVALQGNCLTWALGCMHFSGSKPLRFRLSGTPQRRRLGWACVLCPSQVRAAQRPGAWRAHSFSLAVRLITSPVPAPWFPGCAAGVQFQEGCVSPLGSRSLPVTLLADVNRPGSQEDLVSNRSQFGGECHLWSRDCPSPSGSGCCPPASGEGRDWSRAS